MQEKRQRSIADWRRRLEALAVEIRTAPTPHRGTSYSDETRTRIDRENLMWQTFADLLVEQPEIARLVGVSNATLNEPSGGKRWSQAVQEMTGVNVFAAPHASTPPMRMGTLSAINKLLAESSGSAERSDIATPTDSKITLAAQGPAKVGEGLAGLERPVKLTDVAGIIGKRSDQIGRELRSAQCKYKVVGRCGYAEHQDLIKLFPKYRKHVRKSEL